MEPEDSSDAQSAQERIITDAHEYLKWCQSIKKIKIMDEANPLDSHIYLKDISLHKKGPMEDKLYSKNRMYYLNIRRGNTLCQLYNEQQEPTELFFCRRGMMKFFDMSQEYLQLGAKLTYQHQLYRNVIFDEIDDILKVGGKKLHLYSLFKENGEHCQIGYVGRLDMWLVASKNVTIILKGEADLEAYHKERFYWAKLIARQFLKQIQELSSQELEQLKKDLDGKTLIGEYCGYEQHQHITKYSTIEIIYYAIVENVGYTRCLPVDEAFQLFDRYRMKKVRTTTIKNLTKQNDVYSHIYELLKKAGEGTMKEEGEGSVLYVVSESAKSEQRVVSISKLKTTEYLIFRKMREMLKIQLHKKGVTANTVEKFYFEMEQIVKGSFQPPKPLSYYSKVAERAFKQVGDRMEEMEESELRYRFVTFIEEVEKAAAEELQRKELQLKQASSSREQAINGEFDKVVVVCLPRSFEPDTELNLKQLGVKLEDAFRQAAEVSSTPAQTKSIAIVHMVPRITAKDKNAGVHFVVCKYAPEEKAIILERLSRQKEPYNQSIISFIKSQDREKSLELLLSKLSSFEQLCRDKEVSFEVVEGLQAMQLIPHLASMKLFGTMKAQPKKVSSAGPFRYIVMPFLLPGSGKTTLSNMSDQFLYKTTVISSDKIRQGLYDQIRQSEPEKQFTYDELFKMVGKNVRTQYFAELNKHLTAEISFNEILYLDRIFVFNDLDTELEQLQSNPNHRIVFLTQDGHPWRTNEHEYPFSVSFLLECFRRSIERENHESLNTDAIETLRILLKFYQMFRGCKFGTVEKKHPGVRVLKLQFAKEGRDDDRDLPEMLKNKLKECLRAINPGYDANESSAFSEFVQLYYDYHRQLPNRSPQREHLLKQFNSSLEHLTYN